MKLGEVGTDDERWPMARRWQVVGVVYATNRVGVGASVFASGYIHTVPKHLSGKSVL